MSAAGWFFTFLIGLPGLVLLLDLGHINERIASFYVLTMPQRFLDWGFGSGEPGVLPFMGGILIAAAAIVVIFVR